MNKKLLNIGKTIRTAVATTFREVEADFPLMAAEEQREQLYEGDGGDGPIEPPYTPLTRTIKARKGQPFNRVTLKDTGDFYRSIKLQGKRLMATDGKTRKLVAKYGNHILTMSQSHYDQLSRDVKRLFIIKLQTKWRR